MAKANPQPATNPIDENRQGLIGKLVDRVDGPLKVSGRATYAYEFQPDAPVAYGYIVPASIAKGTVLSIATLEAKAIPGVLMIMTADNAPKQASYGPPVAKQPLERPKPFLDSKNIRYFGEPVAFIVAESFEVARDAAYRLKINYRTDRSIKTDLAANQQDAYSPKSINGAKPDSAVGDFDSAFDSADVKIDATYTTPHQVHNAIEPHAAMAVWKGKKLTIYAAHQLTNSLQKSLAATFDMKLADIHVINHFIGGGFGGKLPTEAEIVLSALAARELKRPVKTAQTRQQLFATGAHRPETLQRVRLGSKRDGTLTAIGHEGFSQTATFDEFAESFAMQTRSLYAADDRKTSHRIVALDLPPGGAMRAPGEAVGMLALEQAMDELAYALDMDPIALRLKNETKTDPEKKLPFSTRALPECFAEGAKRFGWDKRPTKPGSLRDGPWLIGYGMASAFRSNLMNDSEAEVTLDEKGHLTAKLAMTDIGTGSYTILTQIAAETMQLPLDAVTVLIGDSDYPQTPGSGGSWGANSAGSGLFETCMDLRQELVNRAVKTKESPLFQLDPKDATFALEKISIDSKSETYAKIVARDPEKKITLQGKVEKPDGYKKFAQAGFGAHFVEVGVDPITGEVRLRRMLGVFAAGRILNEKTAKSQALGGMLWGLGSALFEDAVTDARYGQFVNHDLAEYHIASHADIGPIEVVYLPEVDDKTGPLKIKGVGELGICGAGAAVANAVYNACGVRVRNYPITLDKVLAGLA